MVYIVVKGSGKEILRCSDILRKNNVKYHITDEKERIYFPKNCVKLKILAKRRKVKKNHKIDVAINESKTKIATKTPVEEWIRKNPELSTRLKNIFLREIKNNTLTFKYIEDITLHEFRKLKNAGVRTIEVLKENLPFVHEVPRIKKY